MKKIITILMSVLFLAILAFNVTAIDYGTDCGLQGGTCCVNSYNPSCPGMENLGSTHDCPGGCYRPISSPSQPTCGAMGGEYCVHDYGSCPSGYESKGPSNDCTLCCDYVGGSVNNDPDCGHIGGTCCAHDSASECSGMDFIDTTWDCPAGCFQPIDAPTLDNCGEMGGDLCMKDQNPCPSGYNDLGPSNDCTTCCKSTGSEPDPDPTPSIYEDCSGADLEINLDNFAVVGVNCHDDPNQRSTTINIPIAGTHVVKGQIERGHPGQCQTNEDFYLKINGVSGPSSNDNDEPCAITTRVEYLGEFDFNSGSNNLVMKTVAQCPPDTTPESVKLNKLCIYYGEEEPYCGDGIVDAGEECEFDFQCGTGGTCVTCECEYYQPVCGNGITDPGEECDDGNDNNFDSCRNDCTLPTCGDGIMDAGEECEFDFQCGIAGICNINCECDYPEPECGNGIVEVGEECDDGNTNNFDDCRNDCTFSDCECEPGETDSRQCGDTDMGECEYGIQEKICQSDCSWGEWGLCMGVIYPTVEICDDLDNDCDFEIDEDLPTIPVDCDYLDEECRDYHDVVSECIEGQYTDPSCNGFTDKPYGYILENIDCDHLDTICRDYHDTEAICDGEGEIIDGECDNYTNSPPCTVCGTLECDHLDTECRDYHDIEAHCDAYGNCIMPTECNEYTDKPYSTPCGCGSTTLYSCYDGNYLGSDIYYYVDGEHCNGEGECEYYEGGWQVYEDCTEFEYCDGPEGSTPNEYDYSCVENPFPPVAVIEADPESGFEDLEVQFSAFDSYDIDGYIVDYCWDFNDGSPTGCFGVAPIHTYTEPGCYDPILTVWDDDGFYDTDTMEICVEEDSEVDVEIDAYFEGCAIPLTVRLVADVKSGNAPFTYLWDFGDGQISTEPIVQHEYDELGDYTVTLSVWDNDGDFAIESIVISTCPDEEYRPKGLISVNRLGILNDDPVKPGDALLALVSFENIAGYDLKDLKLTIGIPALAEWRIFNFREVDEGEEKTKLAELIIPEDALPGYYDLRVSISNDDFRRTKFREFIVE